MWARMDIDFPTQSCSCTCTVPLIITWYLTCSPDAVLQVKFNKPLLSSATLSMMRLKFLSNENFVLSIEEIKVPSLAIVANIFDPWSHVPC